MSEMVKKIGTHDGSFHCDEALACFMLKLLPEYKDAVIVRSRDLTVLDTCDVVVDVGQRYDPSEHRYDHHMRDFKESVSTVIKKPGYDWTIKLSSAGLIYCHFGTEVIRKLVPEVMNEIDIERIFKKVYDSFIKEIDGIDNGVPMFDGEPVYNIETGLSSRVSRLNPPWNDKSMDVEKQFHKAMDLAGAEFVDFVKAAAYIWLPARHIVEAAIEKRYDLDPSGEIIELSPAAPWKEHLFHIEEEQKIETPIKYIIFKDDNYRIQTVPVALRSFVGRMFLPEAWAGLRNEDLCKATGIDGCAFVHTARFIGGNHTREGALEMARKALKIGHSICK